LKKISNESGIPVKKQEQGLRFSGKYFIPGSETGHTTKPYTKDLDEIVQSVKEAGRQADWIMVTSHTHEGDGNRPPEFLKTFAHTVIDAGADMVITTGYHGLRPVEIYNDRPIFYSLGDFIFQNETVKKMPQEMYDRYGVSQDSLSGYLQDKRIEASG